MRGTGGAIVKLDVKRSENKRNKSCTGNTNVLGNSCALCQNISVSHMFALHVNDD
jgi:hypothetical protein